MDLKTIKKLINLMNSNDLAEVEIEEEGQKIRLKKNSAPVAHSPEAVHPSFTQVSHPPVPAPAQEKPGEEEDADCVFINSPMVGTFYRASSPEEGTFVEEGDDISEDTVLCIIEAMKVMNEIKAEIEGKIREILVENGGAVEYGQPLFKVSVS